MLSLAGAAAGVLLGNVSPAASQALATLPPAIAPLASGVEETTFVPDAEAQLLAMLNRTREEHHLAPLVMSEPLHRVARHHSHDMAVQGYVGHRSRQGESFLTRLSGVVPPGTFVGENVTAAATVTSAHAAFMHSPGHAENVLSPTFREVGIGVATAGRLLIVTEDFAD